MIFQRITVLSSIKPVIFSKWAIEVLFSHHLSVEHPPEMFNLLGSSVVLRCPKSTDDERKHPTLCLFCGAILCSQSSCCLSQLDGEDVGACTAHAATCGAGVGMFLRWVSSRPHREQDNYFPAFKRHFFFHFEFA